MFFNFFFVSRYHNDHKDAMNRENEGQRGALRCPRSPSGLVAELSFDCVLSFVRLRLIMSCSSNTFEGTEKIFRHNQKKSNLRRSACLRI